MKNSAKLIASLLLTLAFITACGNCDDGDIDNSDLERDTIASDSTYVK